MPIAVPHFMRQRWSTGSTAWKPGESYFDAEAVLDYAWRKGDSIWALASDHELQTALTQVAELSARGQLQSFMQRYDADRPALGQVSFSVATKN